MNSIAIMVDNDTTWSLPVWIKTIKLLKQHSYSIKGLILTSPKLANLKKQEVTPWYLKTFGLYSFLCLGFIALIRLVIVKLGALVRLNPGSFKQLCQQNDIPLLTCHSPNESHIKKWLQTSDIDILVIMTSHILSSELLSYPKVATVNKHASLLPANKGIFPFIWATLSGQTNGVSFHIVNKEIDSGRLLLQYEVPNNTSSMIGFYDTVMRHYGSNLLKALSNLTSDTPITPQQQYDSSYYGLPNKKDIRQFKRLRGKIVSFIDVLKQIRYPIY